MPLTMMASLQAMMQKAGYPDYPNHKPLHTDFLAELAKLSTPVSQAQIDFAKTW